MRHVDESTVTASRPMEELQSKVAPVMAQTVDALHVAALLEADGVTDARAQREYGYDDVFALASELRRRILPEPVTLTTRSPAPPARRASSRWPRSWVERQRAAFARQLTARRVPHDGDGLRLVSHGALYLLPATIFPAVLSLMSTTWLIFGLAVGCGVAWVWAAGATWMAYQHAGSHRDASAARVLHRSALGGLPLALATGGVVAVTTGGSWGFLAAACGQMTYQMGATVLIYFRKERVLFTTMLPGVLVGVGYLVPAVGVPGVVAILVGAVCVVAVFCTALKVSRRHAAQGSADRDGPRPAASTATLGLVVLYTALTAAYLLHAQSRYVQSSLDVAIGLLPLITGMGVVELQAARFRTRARNVMATVQYPREFAAGVRWLLAVDILVCFAAVAALGAGLSYALDRAGVLSPAGLMMTLASMFLAGTYYLGFLLMAMSRLLPLITSTGACLVAHLVVASRIPVSHPLADSAAFVGTSLGLLVLFATAVLPSVTQPRAHA